MPFSLPEPSSLLMLLAALAILISYIVLGREKKLDPETDQLLLNFSNAEAASFDAYGQLTPRQRVERFLREFLPYGLLLGFTGASRSFDVLFYLFGATTARGAVSGSGLFNALES